MPFTVMNIQLFEDAEIINGINKILNVFMHDFGIATSDVNTNQQWDLPNNWAPNV